MMPVDDLNDLIGSSLPSEDFDTVGGFVFHLFGKLPIRGEEISFNDFTFSVEKMSRARILKIKVAEKEVEDGK
jgi:Mg2+/Co2+ transporter CorC